jgi:biotin operon repressor
MTVQPRIKGSPHNAKLDTETARLVRSSKQSNAELARLIGVSRETIRKCRKEITWAHR